MSICEKCNSSKNRSCSYADRTQEFYNVLIPALTFVARKCGYALATHGSLKSDIDLIAAPWREHAISQESLAEEIRLTAERIIGYAISRHGPTKKPEGRLAWSFYLQTSDFEGPYIDLSVMPLQQKKVKK